MIRQLTTIVVVALLIAGNNARTARIVNGTDDYIEYRPYVVSVQHNGTHKCGGSIISKDYILTAGHCIKWDYKLSLLEVRSGSTMKEQGGFVNRVKNFYRPPDFRELIEVGCTSYGDLALLKLEEPLEYDETRQPIVLFNADEKYQPGVSAVVSGSGSTKTATYNGQLQSVAVPIVNDDVCKTAYSYLGVGQFCAGYYGKGEMDSCGGDSGGPLVVNEPFTRQVGIVSFGSGCARAHHPGVYTEIAHFREWIDKYVTV